jgi:hypothetical protein
MAADHHGVGNRRIAHSGMLVAPVQSGTPGPEHDVRNRSGHGDRPEALTPLRSEG